MRSLELLEEHKAMHPKRFWARQFQQTATEKQKNFDWAFGVVVPTLCVLVDPIVFRGGFGGIALFGNYKPFAYSLSFVSILGMVAWLIWGERLKWGKSFLAGLFLFGSLVSLAVGIVLLPFSLVGLLLFLLGTLGFTPLLAAIVYLRNGVRALRSAAAKMDRLTLVHSVALSALLSFAVPFALNAEIRGSLDAMRDGDHATIHREAAKLRFVAPLVNFDVMALERYRKDQADMTTPEMQAVAQVYFEMTGEELKRRHWIFD